MNNNLPEILAPAGDRRSFLAALAAGADAVYLGLKHFSARMQSENFSIHELSGLVDLAHAENRKVYIALNSMLKPDDLEACARLIAGLKHNVCPDALIVQDLAVLELARQVGFKGEIHLSTLANITQPRALSLVKSLGVARVILPRELSVDEVKLMAEHCPEGLGLECFVHGALCYCVSGRCYWSSYMGGKSGLRGHCVQPCRRIYKQNKTEAAFFSCMDLSLDVLAKLLLDISAVSSWKIEGRRKGPHYVYHVVTAYKMLRDFPTDPQAKKDALNILDMSLGRVASKAGFLPQKDNTPTMPFASFKDKQRTQGLDKGSGKGFGQGLSRSSGQGVAMSLARGTASGLLIGKVSLEAKVVDKKGAAKSSGQLFGQGKQPKNSKSKANSEVQIYEYIFKPYKELLVGDYLRIGTEDESWHFTFAVNKPVPKGGTFTLTLPRHKLPKAGTPIFLLDRRSPELGAVLKTWENKAVRFKGRQEKNIKVVLQLPPKDVKGDKQNILLRSSIPQGRDSSFSPRSNLANGLWLTSKSLNDVSRTVFSKVSWWLPPVIWPEEEKTFSCLAEQAVLKGARNFVCNAPWQMALLQTTALKEPEQLKIMAGPFCNCSNALHIKILKDMGFCGVIVSPELSEQDYLMLGEQSSLPLGLVLEGFFPLGISRYKFNKGKLNEAFISPKSEKFWARHYGRNLWIYPAWPLDLKEKKDFLIKVGYSVFVNMLEKKPEDLESSERPGLFNWDLGLL